MAQQEQLAEGTGAAAVGVKVRRDYNGVPSQPARRPLSRFFFCGFCPVAFPGGGRKRRKRETPHDWGGRGGVGHEGGVLWRVTVESPEGGQGFCDPGHPSLP
ncbi:hypothetical protein COCON_G00160700 [Conger conger]|uniref:Uncharacterized protein n=1 Tax=Conger conger TaxID=82655 RepID=A0A9Q1DA62_CONCO|nr:hypothetical protein COCON_G00160700 [Conger conger]